MLTEGHVLDGPGVIPDAWMRKMVQALMGDIILVADI